MCGARQNLLKIIKSKLACHRPLCFRLHLGKTTLPPLVLSPSLVRAQLNQISLQVGNLFLCHKRSKKRNHNVNKITIVP